MPLLWAGRIIANALAQAQTPQQRKANLKFHKDQEQKMGKPPAELKKKESFKSPVSPIWLGRFPPFCFVPGARPPFEIGWVLQ